MRELRLLPSGRASVFVVNVKYVSGIRPEVRHDVKHSRWTRRSLYGAARITPAVNSLSYWSCGEVFHFLGVQPLILQAAEPQRVLPSERCPQKENLGRVVHP